MGTKSHALSRPGHIYCWSQKHGQKWNRFWGFFVLFDGFFKFLTPWGVIPENHRGHPIAIVLGNDWAIWSLSLFLVKPHIAAPASLPRKEQNKKYVREVRLSFLFDHTKWTSGFVHEEMIPVAFMVCKVKGKLTNLMSDHCRSKQKWPQKGQTCNPTLVGIINQGNMVQRPAN